MISALIVIKASGNALAFAAAITAFVTVKRKFRLQQELGTLEVQIENAKLAGKRDAPRRLLP